MKTPRSRPIRLALVAILVATTGGMATAASPAESELRRALTFHASFDGVVDADFALGDRRLWHAPDMKQRTNATPGLPPGDAVSHAKSRGRFGDALRFTERKTPLVFFKAAKNVAYRARNWSGAVSLWLCVDPAAELEPGFCDPIQITPRAWNDAAFFVEFEKRKEDIPFRLGAYADFKVWNPNNRKWEEIPAIDKPLITVSKPPFARGKWTHVVFTWEDFNTGKPEGVARLYLDGKWAGALEPSLQTYTWEPEHTLVMLGLSYIGLWDELSCFNRALTDEEVNVLYALPGGVKPLLHP
ncbi:MAG TPA: LamG-like jellyroll fold domain-containing protein [Methylomirabilota bacterium]|nr:LamG-like jellyroll fold domain-containing protein [Methylomirabilota bacterium]